jgi:uncharacterized protein (TIGR00369 family)
MSGSYKENSTKGEPELTELQIEGIATKLANNPVIKFVGIELLGVRAGHATLVLPFQEELHNSMGLIQGGILGVLADVAGGVSLYSLLADPAKVVIPTVEFKLNFLRPARQGDILARGKVTHLGRQFAVCQVDICTREEAFLATGLFTYMIQNAERIEQGKR